MRWIDSPLWCYWKPALRKICLLLLGLLLLSMVAAPPLTAFADTLTVLKPNGGEILRAGGTYTAEWSGYLGETVYVFVIVDEPYQYYVGTSSSNSLLFTVPNHPTDNARLHITIDGASRSDTSDGDFTITDLLVPDPWLPVFPIQPIKPLDPSVFKPLAPSDLAVTANADTHTSLEWTDNAINEAHFEIERKTEGGTFQKIGETAANVTVFTDNNVTPGILYTYQVRAVNGFGASGYSNPVDATPPMVTGSPGHLAVNLTAQPLSDTEIQLDWEDTTMGNDVFHVERDGVEIATVADTKETYKDSGLKPDTTYTYRLRLDKPPQEPLYSGTANARTLAEGETPPIPGFPPIAPGGAGTVVIHFDIGSTDYYINGVLQTMDTAPVIYEGRTLLPIKYVAGPLGADVGWDPGPRRVRITHRNRLIDLWIGQNRAEVNGTGQMIDPNNANVTPIVMPPGRTMLPLKFISVQMGAQVDWDPLIQRVTVTYEE